MKSRWRSREAERLVRAYKRRGVNRDLALRVYTTRLLGRDPALVLHGGGNNVGQDNHAGFFRRAC